MQAHKFVSQAKINDVDRIAAARIESAMVSRTTMTGIKPRGSWIGDSTFSMTLQELDWECGPIAVQAVMRSLGVARSLPHIVSTCKSTELGTSARRMICGLREMDFSVGIHTDAGIGDLRRWKLSKKALIGYITTKDHWVSIAWIHSTGSMVVIADPLEGFVEMPWKESVFGSYALTVSLR